MLILPQIESTATVKRTHHDLCHCDVLRRQETDARRSEESLYDAEMKKWDRIGDLMEPRYTIVSVLKLLELINTVANLCAACTSKEKYRGRLHATHFAHVGQALDVTMTCDHGHTTRWQSSLRTGKFLEINRAIPAAWEISGLEMVKHTTFSQALGLHPFNPNIWTDAVKEFGRLVAKPHEEELIAENVAKMNAAPEELVLAIDSNFSRSHRPLRYNSDGEWVKGGPAPSSSSTIMCRGEIIHQQHVHLKDLRAAKPAATGRERKDDLGTRLALEAIGDRVRKVARVTFDGCTSAGRIVADFEKRFPQHQGILVTKDNWHFEKNLKKKFNNALKATIDAPKETRPPKARARTTARPSNTVVEQIDAFSGKRAALYKNAEAGSSQDAKEEEESEEEQDEEEEEQAAADGTRYLGLSSADRPQGEPPAKRARTGKRTKKVKRYRDLIDAGITGDKFVRWVQFSMRGISARQRSEVAESVMTDWGVVADVKQMVVKILNFAPYAYQGFPNTGKPNEQRALLEECWYHWGEKHALGQESLDLLGEFLDNIIKQLPTLTYNDSTSALESFHRSCLKYMSKTLAYTDETYDRRRSYAALDWTYRRRGIDEGRWKARLVQRYIDVLRQAPPKG